jgi:hypothetical protein
MNLLHTSPKNWFEAEMYMLGFVDQLQSHPDYPTIAELLSELNYLQPELSFDL